MISVVTAAHTECRNRRGRETNRRFKLAGNSKGPRRCSVFCSYNRRASGRHLALPYSICLVYLQFISPRLLAVHISTP